jgi:hypothetical protein
MKLDVQPNTRQHAPSIILGPQCNLDSSSLTPTTNDIACDVTMSMCRNSSTPTDTCFCSRRRLYTCSSGGIVPADINPGALQQVSSYERSRLSLSQCGNVRAVFRLCYLDRCGYGQRGVVDDNEGRVQAEERPSRI